MVNSIASSTLVLCMFSSENDLLMLSLFDVLFVLLNTCTYVCVCVCVCVCLYFLCMCASYSDSHGDERRGENI